MATPQPKDAAAELWNASVALAWGDAAEADRLIWNARKLLRHQPSDPVVHTALARLLLDRGRREEGIEHALSAWRLARSADGLTQWNATLVLAEAGVFAPHHSLLTDRLSDRTARGDTSLSASGLYLGVLMGEIELLDRTRAVTGISSHPLDALLDRIRSRGLAGAFRSTLQGIHRLASPVACRFSVGMDEDPDTGVTVCIDVHTTLTSAEDRFALSGAIGMQDLSEKELDVRAFVAVGVWEPRIPDPEASA